MRSAHPFGGLFALVLMIAITADGAEVSKRRCYEGFSTREYRDLENTTVFWDTIPGELKLHPVEITLRGAYNTSAPPMALSSRRIARTWSTGRTASSSST